jgi:signal transduction histidine kinase
MSWPYAYTPYIWPMLASAIFLAGLAAYAWTHRTVPGAGPFSIQMALSALWALCATMQIAATDESPKIVWFKLGMMSAIPAMSAMLYFALEYAGLRKWTSRRIVLLLSTLALVASGVMATNDPHHLLWARLWFDGFVRFERGPLYPVILGYGLLLPTLSLLIFLRLALRSSRIYRGQGLLLFCGDALPLLAFLLQPAGLDPVAPLNPTILMLNVTGLLFTLAIYRFGMLGVVPVGRDTAMERMADGVVILDAKNRIIDLNPAAGQLLALVRRTTIGRPAGQALAAYPDLARLLEHETATSAEISLNGADQPRSYQANISPLTDARGFKLGRLVLLQDVTELKRTRELLEQQRRAIAAQQEREHLARELHDTVGQVFAFINVQGQTVRRLLARGEIASADQYVARLLEAASDADTDIRESIAGLRSSFSAQGFFPALAGYLERYEENCQIDTGLTRPETWGEGAFEPAVEVQLMRILQEALANTRKHSHARRVHLAFTEQNGCAQVVVQDDGQGFDLEQVRGGSSQKFGLRLMRERAEEVGGSLAVYSQPGQGTKVVVQMPLAHDAPSKEHGGSETR